MRSTGPACTQLILFCNPVACLSSSFGSVSSDCPATICNKSLSLVLPGQLPTQSLRGASSVVEKQE